MALDDHLTLLQLARRGEAARQAAEQRLAMTPEVVRSFELDQSYLRRWKGAQYLVKAAPHTIPPQLTEWPMTEAAGDACKKAAATLMTRTGGPGLLGHRLPAQLRPFGRGVEATVAFERGDATDEAVALADSAGVFAVAKREGLSRGHYVGLIQAILDEHLRPLAESLARLLRQRRSSGPVRWI